jgi:hypothetical protein
MYELIIDFSILVDFLIGKPKDIFNGGTIEEDNYWKSLLFFLKSGANVEIINFDNSKNELLTLINFLTSGRENSCIKITENFSKPYKNTFKDKSLFTICFLKESDEKEIQKFKKNNPFTIAFNQEYISTWKKLSFVNQNKTIPIRKESKNDIQKMGDFEQFIIKVTDVIIFDTYILDHDLLEYNVIDLLETFKKSTTDYLNVLIISHEKKVSESPLQKRYEKFIEIINQKKLLINACVVFTQSKLKEHDRHLIINNLRIKSGDSFKYFDSKGNVITNGTEIDLYPLVQKENLENTQILIEKAKQILESVPKSHIFGSCKNRFI